MKVFTVCSLLLLSVVSLASGFGLVAPNFYTYAPRFGYANFGSPVATPVRTALDVLQPNFVYPFAHSPFPYNVGFTKPVKVVQATKTPAVAAANVPLPSLRAAAAAAAVTAADDEVIAVEADSSPLVASGPVELRNIFPVFGTDLRSGAPVVSFLKPTEVKPIVAELDEEAAEDVVILPAVAPEQRRATFAPAAFSAAPFTAPFGIPAGIVQASQPTFF